MRKHREAKMSYYRPFGLGPAPYTGLDALVLPPLPDFPIVSRFLAGPIGYGPNWRFVG